jgi:hypothetical protein
VRRSLARPAHDVLYAAKNLRVLAVFGLLVLWCVPFIWLAAHFGVWDLSLLKDSIILVVVVGFPILFKSVGQKSGTRILRDVVRDTLRPTAILVFYLNLESLPLWTELIAVPLFTFLVLLNAMAGTKPEWRRTQGCIGVVLAILGVGLIAWTVILTVQQFAQTDWMAVALGFALSVWLPVVMFPCFYAASFYAASELDLTMLRFKSGTPTRVQLAAFLCLRFSLKWAAAFRGKEYPVGQLRTFRDASHAMRDFRAATKRDSQLEKDRIQQLRDHVGVP